MPENKEVINKSTKVDKTKSAINTGANNSIKLAKDSSVPVVKNVCDKL